MKFDIVLTDLATKHYENLQINEQNKLAKTFSHIETYGLEGTNIKSLKGYKNLFEIKVSNIRALYTYKEGRMIIVGVIFIKKSQKTPSKFIDMAIKELNI